MVSGLVDYCPALSFPWSTPAEKNSCRGPRSPAPPWSNGRFIFILSSLKLPSVTGSCSHPTGTGLSTISFGPWITAVVCAIVLLFQSLFLAHGGLSVLGANIVSMGIVGPFVGYSSLPDSSGYRR